jgi:hypothetical protein
MKQKGVTGFIDTAESLEKVSAAKGEIDEAKGQTLEEISKFVTEINQVSRPNVPRSFVCVYMCACVDRSLVGNVYHSLTEYFIRHTEYRVSFSIR